MKLREVVIFICCVGLVSCLLLLHYGRARYVDLQLSYDSDQLASLFENYLWLPKERFGTCDTCGTLLLKASSQVVNVESEYTDVWNSPIYFCGEHKVDYNKIKIDMGSDGHLKEIFSK